MEVGTRIIKQQLVDEQMRTSAVALVEGEQREGQHSSSECVVIHTPGRHGRWITCTAE